MMSTLKSHDRRATTTVCCQRMVLPDELAKTISLGPAVDAKSVLVRRTPRVLHELDTEIKASVELFVHMVKACKEKDYTAIGC